MGRLMEVGQAALQCSPHPSCPACIGEREWGALKPLGEENNRILS